MKQYRCDLCADPFDLIPDGGKMLVVNEMDVKLCGQCWTAIKRHVEQELPSLNATNEGEPRA